jgi:hypothetical protein
MQTTPGSRFWQRLRHWVDSMMSGWERPRLIDRQ